MEKANASRTQVIEVIVSLANNFLNFLNTKCYIFKVNLKIITLTKL